MDKEIYLEKQIIYSTNQQTNYISLPEEQQIMLYIGLNNIQQLHQIDIKSANLNFNEKIDNVEIDNLISPLVYATYLGYQEIAKLLLTNSYIDLDYTTGELNYTPLMIACIKGQYEIAKMLIEEGCNLNHYNLLGHQAFLYCFSRLDSEMHLYENKQICFKLVKLLLENGQEINSQVDNIQKYSILMIFCQFEYHCYSQSQIQLNYDIIKFLIENGADIHYSPQKKVLSPLKLLEKHRNKQNVLDLFNKTKQIYFPQSVYQTNKIQNQRPHQRAQIIMENDEQFINRQNNSNKSWFEKLFCDCSCR